MAQLPFDLEWILLGLGLVALVALGAFAVGRCRQWQEEQRSAGAPMHVEDYRALLEQGLLEPSEFERIKGRLEGSLGVDHKPDAPARDGSKSVAPTQKSRSGSPANDENKGLA